MSVEQTDKNVEWTRIFFFSPIIYLFFPCVSCIVVARRIKCRPMGRQKQLIQVPVMSALTSSHLSLNREGRWWHRKWFHNQFPPFFSVLHYPPGLGEIQACPFPDVVFPSLLLSALSSSPFHCALQGGFGQTMNGSHVHTTAVCVSLPQSGGLPVVHLPAGSWHGFPH